MKCEDDKCFIHGSLRIRGSVVTGRVVSDKVKRSVIVERDLIEYAPKYQRYKRKRSRIPAHNPDCLGAKAGINCLIDALIRIFIKDISPIRI